MTTRSPLPKSDSRDKGPGRASQRRSGSGRLVSLEVANDAASVPEELSRIQHFFAGAIMRPWTSGHTMQRKWEDGRPMSEVAAEYITPGPHLSSFERLEIYNQQYWLRTLEALADDFPGVRSIVGARQFEKLSIAYLRRYPSTSYTMRNLGSKLPQFLEEEPRWVAPYEKAAQDMARLEWAEVVAFDGEGRPPLTPADLAGCDPEKLTIALQPFLTLLQLDYPLDDYLIDVKKSNHERPSEASISGTPRRRRKRLRLPPPERIYLAVYRLDNVLYYKHMTKEAFRLLCAIDRGEALGVALGEAFGGRQDDPAAVREWSQKVSDWFAVWTELGWFCKAE